MIRDVNSTVSEMKMEHLDEGEKIVKLCSELPFPVESQLHKALKAPSRARTILVRILLSFSSGAHTPGAEDRRLVPPKTAFVQNGGA